jgi:hypothetical protein
MGATETYALDNDRKIAEFAQIPISRVVGDDYTERQLRMKKAWRAYLGELPPPLRRDGKTNDNVVVNPAAAIVNIGVHFLFGEGLTWAGDFDNKTPPQWYTTLTRCWKANKQPTFLLNLGISGGINGHCFVRFVPNSAGYRNEYTRLVVLDPCNVDVKWNADDYEDVREFVITSQVPDGRGNKVTRVERIKKADDGLTWTMQKFERRDVSNFFRKATEVEVPVGPLLVWNYPWPPIVHCQNLPLPNTFWGMSDLEPQVISIIVAQQTAMSNLNKIIRIHAAPKTVLTGMTSDLASEIDVSPDGMISFPDPDANLKVLEMISNLDSSLKFVDKIEDNLDRMTQVPKIAYGEGDSATAQLSGVSASVFYGPLIQKTEAKWSTYGDMLLDISIKLLILDGAETADAEDSLRIEWPVPIPGSKFLERQTLAQDLALGASQDTILAKLGYDPAVERTNRMAQLQESTDQKIAEAKGLAAIPQVSKPVVAPSQPAAPSGGNNNPQGQGNKSGSMGGVNSAGVTKTQPGTANPGKSNQ